MDDKKFEFFKIDDLLKDGESINPYGGFDYQPSKGKLNRMILAGYYALRWINEKLDNAQDFVENILALRAEANRIVGELPAPKNKPEMFHVEQSENINPAENNSDHFCCKCKKINNGKYYEIPYIDYTNNEYTHIGSNYICEDCAAKLSALNLLKEIYTTGYLDAEPEM